MGVNRAPQIFSIRVGYTPPNYAVWVVLIKALDFAEALEKFCAKGYPVKNIISMHVVVGEVSE